MPVLEDGLSNLLTDDDFQVQPLHKVLESFDACNSALHHAYALMCGPVHALYFS